MKDKITHHGPVVAINAPRRVFDPQLGPEEADTTNEAIVRPNWPGDLQAYGYLKVRWPWLLDLLGQAERTSLGILREKSIIEFAEEVVKRFFGDKAAFRRARELIKLLSAEEAAKVLLEKNDGKLARSFKLLMISLRSPEINQEELARLLQEGKLSPKHATATRLYATILATHL